MKVTVIFSFYHHFYRIYFNPLPDDKIVVQIETKCRRYFNVHCCGKPLLQAWLLPDLNTIPSNFIGENSLKPSGYGIGFLSKRPWFKSCRKLTFLPCIYSFVSLLRTLFVRWGLVWDWPKSH